MPRNTARPGSSLTINRLLSAVAACLLSYLAACLVLKDFVRWAGPNPVEAATVGDIVIVAFLPVLILTGFGGNARQRGLLVVCALGGLAALGCLA
ncbi:hypothetical protein [Komagataeibacter sp. FNDCR2]|uniref:hypothetical protein n=1 Tax=Komagataeibacter sp. FNDCR2 TaxID=2878682 RepID=UPI001E56153D|nr:hypothetical protein [Komagataeibacter sp. FNDCR2]MCE2574249.1 hypothetical protein [Komagataeibacter sp. FNDCR2]